MGFETSDETILQVVPLVSSPNVADCHSEDSLTEGHLPQLGLSDTFRSVGQGPGEDSETAVRQTLHERFPVGAPPELIGVVYLPVIAAHHALSNEVFSVVRHTLCHVSLALCSLPHPEGPISVAT